jgi:hypothetical protein
MTWTNADGLFVKFGTEEGVVTKAGSYKVHSDGSNIWEVILTKEDLGTAPAIYGEGLLQVKGSAGLLLPKGLFLESVEVLAEVAATTSGALASATLQIGLVREDRTTVYDVAAITANTLVGTALDTAGERTTIVKGSTGAGTLIGTVLANAGYLVAANTGNAANPFTAGKFIVRIKGYFPKP